jgi:hypothetical protein
LPAAGRLANHSTSVAFFRNIKALIEKHHELPVGFLGDCLGCAGQV